MPDVNDHTSYAQMVPPQPVVEQTTPQVVEPETVDTVPLGTLGPDEVTPYRLVDAVVRGDARIPSDWFARNIMSTLPDVAPPSRVWRLAQDAPSRDSVRPLEPRQIMATARIDRMDILTSASPEAARDRQRERLVQQLAIRIADMLRITQDYDVATDQDIIVASVTVLVPA